MAKKKPKPNAGQFKPILKAPLVAEKLIELNGSMAAVARHFGVSRQAVSNLVSKHESLQAACHDARESMKDHAESSLYRSVLAGEAWGVCFYLKTQAKDRGYVERTEHDHSGTLVKKKIVVEIVHAASSTDAGALGGSRAALPPASNPG